MHWTQTAEGKRKMALAQQKAWAKRRRDKKKPAPVNEVAQPKGRLAREEIVDLARRGAEQRLREIEQEAVKLRVFLGRPIEQ